MNLTDCIAKLVFCLLFFCRCMAMAQEPGAAFSCIISHPTVPVQISADIYGLAAPTAATVKSLRAPLIRWGGNPSERYNWQLGNAWNTGKDWFFENVAVGSHAWQNFLELAESAGARVFFNLPLIGFVAKDTVSHSYSVKKYGAQQKSDVWRPDAGNGVLLNGRPLTGNDRTDASIVASPEFIVAWVQEMKKQFPKLFSERRIVFALGNEPMLWHLTHRDVHPEPVTYDEYLSRFVNMAKAIKKAVPEAEIAGPELWGWPAYFQSAKDIENKGNDDRRRHGGEDFLPWFMRQMHIQESIGGVRLLDYVTVHFYPQAQNVFSPAVDLSATQLRLETIRSLWDPNYLDPSWINAKVNLIPRLKRWVNESYPGTKIGLTEYNWGGEEDISGALALADILGILGREGVDLASYWTTPADGSFAAAAYALYRNADGAGAGFGSALMRTHWEGPSPDKVSVFAALDDRAGMASVIAVNKSGVPRSLRLKWDGVKVDAGPAFVLDSSGPRITALTESVSPLRILTVGARSAVHWRFQLK